jgi:hypothetical protein
MNSSVFFRLLDSEDKAASLQKAIAELNGGNHSPFEVHIVAPESFSLVPGSPLAYWVSDAVRSLFSTLPKFGTDGRAVKQGLATADDFRFVRAWWEVPVAEMFNPSVECTVDNARRICLDASRAGTRWFSFAKGGDYLAFYADIHLVLNWAIDGEELKAWADPLYGNSGWSRILKSVDFYFRPGYTYPLRTSRFCPQIMPAGIIISVRGSGIYGDTTGLHLALLASKPFDYLVKMMLGWASRPQFDMGDISATPVPQVGIADSKRLSELALSCATQKRKGLTLFEETHGFLHPAIVLPGKRGSLENAANAWHRQAEDSEANILCLWREIDDIAFRLYGLSEGDRKAIDGGAISALADSEEGADSAADSEGESVANDRVQTVALTTDLISYSFGVVFGRWDIRYATGEQASPKLPDPFAPLPVCPPGQLQNAEGLPARREDVPASYPVHIPWDGILVDDAAHKNDIEVQVHQVLKIIWKDEWESIEREACEILGVKSLRDYLRKPTGFFADHVKRYSKSRRTAPIYWPLATGSGSYTLWIYYHRLTDQTLFQCVNDFVKPKITEVEGDLSRLTTAGADKPGARAEIERLTILRAELVEFRDELLRVAQLPYKPNLNDGVLVTASPLWKLFRLPKWQKDLKACWTALENEEYEWAHLAYTLWPDRVKAVCKRDRSIAIAHGLEELCAVKAPEKKAKKKKKEQMEMEEDSA